MSKSLTHLKDGLLDALNEGRLQGRVEALEDFSRVCDTLGLSADFITIELALEQALKDAKGQLARWFKE